MAVDPSAQDRQPYMPQQPYAQHQPYARPPQRPAVNGLAITSLVVGIVCCLPPLGLVLGAVALGQLRRKGERGKGMAVAGIVLSSLSTLLVLLMVVTGEAREAWNGMRDGFKEAARSKSTQDLRKGDCFGVPGSDLEGEVVDVDVVDCDEEHDAEVTGAYRLKKSDPAPGSPTGEAFAAERCLEINDAYAPDSWALPKDVQSYYYLPTEESWARGDRTVTCSLAGGRLEGSLRVDPETHDPDQLSYINAELAVENATLHGEPDAEFPDDPAAHRSWATRTAFVLREKALALNARSWPQQAAPVLRARAKQFEAAAGEWDRAGKAKDEDAFRAHVTAAKERVTVPARVAARDALGLSTTPPADDE